MTRVDFYVLPTGDAHSRRVLACRLTEKAIKQRLTVFLYAASEEEEQVLDDLLWTFRQGSFVAHERLDALGAQTEAPVLIGHRAAPQLPKDILINLSPATPPDLDRFERLIEIVDQDEAIRQAGRRRYRFYMDQGLTVHTHRLDKPE
ncbi:DNA polymerase III subunit chi [Methylocaldum szegediense]|uniref:DNA polymerase III subunit chi n=1 Tax=Methylocaldum szegediense TaxID=73780 RepID=A0ABM9HW56_9GAMM|nr:DNA polymerase III subunit chi [Methylocaldum szegediense]CAI8725986.1 DNA polymerase III subunit chi [Methylocaldum szegediense]